MKTALPDSLNICLTAYHFPILGRATDQGFLWPIAKGLAKSGHKVTVISARSPLGKQEVSRDGVRVFYLHEGFPNYSHKPFQEAVLEKFLEIHKQEPFQIVHSMDRSALLIAKSSKQLNVAVTYDVQATQMAQIFSILGMGQETIRSQLYTAAKVAYIFLKTYFRSDRTLLKNAAGIFVTTPQQRLALERYYQYPDWSTYTVPYGLEIGDLAPRENRSELYSKLNLPENSHILLTTTDMKDPRELANLFLAFEKVAIKKPNTFLIVIGSGPKQKEVEFEMLNLALGSRVRLTGALKADEISDYVDLATVYINMSSTTSGVEPIMIEAMAQKKIIVGSEVSPIATIVEDGVDGFLLRPADVDSMSSILVEIFSGALPAEEIGERARAKVVNIFDVKRMISGLEEAYKKILLNSGRYQRSLPPK